MNDLETRIRTEFHGREGDAPAFDLADARHVAGRTRRRQILNAASAGVGALAIVVALTTGLGGLLRADRVPADRPPPAPTEIAGVALPIEYPVGEELPDLGDAPGPLAAVWLVPSETGAEPEVVGLVAETGTFGTLAIDVSKYYMAPGAYFALSPDGRRIAYDTSTEALAVRDLVSGESYSPTFEFEIRRERWYTWVDATHLVGHHLAGTGSEADGWVWQPGTAPKMVDLMTYPGSPYLGPHAGVYEQPWFLTLLPKGGPRECLSLRDGQIPVLCDVVGVIGPEVALTHDGDGTVVALDINGVEDPALRHVVATAGAPQGVTFATDLIAEALDADGGAP